MRCTECHSSYRLRNNKLVTIPLLGGSGIFTINFHDEVPQDRPI